MENEYLTQSFLESEVKEAVWNCESFKSSGPDGFNFKFLKECWETVKPDFMRMLDEFHRNGKLVKGSNPSFIVLIPKKDGASSLEDYRPISLIGCTYKVLAKILAGRLSRAIGGLISECQSEFMGGRSILDGVVVLNEAIEEVKRKKLERVFVKIDFAKAYDSVDWEFLDDMLQHFNFCSKCTSWIGECVSSATATVLVNGNASGEFKLERGLQQGDPLSPLLYLIVAEGLSALINRAVHGVFF